MSADTLRITCVKQFEALAETMTNAAINMTPGATPSADQYAMAQVDRLAQARAFMAAAKIVTDEYRKMTEPQQVETNVEVLPKTKRTMY